jgi:hypothetical protein
MQFFTGFNKSLLDVQDKKGKERKTPFEPTLAIGKNFEFSPGFGFSPQLGYIHNIIVSDDGYSEYKMHTFFILYDFLWIPSSLPDLATRFGIGNFIKRISGEGGTVTIPNGSGTATAYRPKKERQSSYSNTFNFGLDYNFNFSASWFDSLALRFELFIFRPLSKEYRNYAYHLGTVFYF